VTTASAAGVQRRGETACDHFLSRCDSLESVPLCLWGVLLGIGSSARAWAGSISESSGKD
jgi:hypothetical protein